MADWSTDQTDHLPSATTSSLQLPLMAATVLGIPELVGIICDYLSGVTEAIVEEEYLERDCRAALAAFAATCCFINDIANDLLWRKLESLAPLVNLLPPECRVEESPQVRLEIPPATTSRTHCIPSLTFRTHSYLMVLSTPQPVTPLP